MKLNELAIRDPQHVMVFGDSKTGKSTIVSQLAEAGYKLVWISCDNGHSILYKLSPEAQQNVDIIVVPDTKDSPLAYDTVKKLIKGKPAEVCHHHGVVACSVCKTHNQPFSGYEFNKLPLDHIVVIDHETAISDSCKNIITKGKPEDYKLQLDDWGSLAFFLINHLKDIQAARFNIVAIAQCEEVVMEDKSKKINPAIGSREFSKLTCQYFDHVVYCKIMNRSHKFGSSTTFETAVLTGSRFDVAVETMEKPSLVPFFDGSHKPKVDPAVQAAAQKVYAEAAAQLQASAQATPVAQDAAKPVTTSSTSSLLEKLKQRTAGAAK